MDDENVHVSERRHGKSSRSLRLPPDASEVSSRSVVRGRRKVERGADRRRSMPVWKQDNIRAQHENGVLKICIDKKEKHESTARSIQITRDYPFAK